MRFSFLILQFFLKNEKSFLKFSFLIHRSKMEYQKRVFVFCFSFLTFFEASKSRLNSDKIVISIDFNSFDYIYQYLVNIIYQYFRICLPLSAPKHLRNCQLEANSSLIRRYSFSARGSFMWTRSTVLFRTLQRSPVKRLESACKIVLEHLEQRPRRPQRNGE